VKEMKEAFVHIEQFLNIMEECDTNAQKVCKYVEPWIRIQLARLLNQDKKQTVVLTFS